MSTQARRLTPRDGTQVICLTLGEAISMLQSLMEPSVRPVQDAPWMSTEEPQEPQEG